MCRLPQALDGLIAVPNLKKKHSIYIQRYETAFAVMT